MSVIPLRPAKGQGGGAPTARSRRPSVSLTPEETAGLAATLKNLNRRYSWAVLAAEMGVSKDTLHFAANGHSRGSPGLALLVARVAGISVDRVLHPGPAPVASCPHCGGALEGT